jgi:hypothetical protein
MVGFLGKYPYLWGLNMLNHIHERMEEQTIFHEDFIYGLGVGIALLLVFLMSMLGINFALENNQVHAYTLLWIDSMFMLSYYYLKKQSIKNFERFYTALAIAVFVFEVHDNLWVISTIFCYKELMFTNLKEVFIASTSFYVAKFSRNMILTTGSFLLFRKHLRLGYNSLIFFGIVFVYWISAIYFRVVYVTWIEMFVIDSLVLFALLKGE